MTRTKRHPGHMTQVRPGVWRIRLSVGTKLNAAGKRVGDYRSFTIEGTRTDAVNFAVMQDRKLNAERKRKRKGVPGRVLLSSLIDEYEADELPELAPGTQTSYKLTFNVLRTYFSTDPYISDVAPEDVKAFLRWRRTHRVGEERGTVSRHTINRDLRVLRLLLNHAVNARYIEVNPALPVKPRKPPERAVPILSDAEYERLIEAAAPNPMLQTWIVLLGETGLRSLSEALKLTWADVDLDAGFIHVRSAPGRRTKSGKSRFVPMTPRLRATLRVHQERVRATIYPGGRPEHLFHHTRNRRGYVAGQPIRSFQNAFARAVRQAKLPTGFRAHDLRHRRVTVWLAEGRPAALVQEALGHSSFAVTDGYKHLAKEHLRGLVEPITQTERGKDGRTAS